jgi:selenide,water dikinase
VLILTKAIGTGILSTAMKRASAGDEKMARIASDDVARSMIDGMKTLNGAASRAALAVGARCATDVTGFGLLGHASHIARASNVTLLIHANAVSVLPGTKEAWNAGATNDGLKRNQEYLEPLVEWKTDDTVMRALLCDPQTSGGLIVAVPRDRASDYLSRVDQSFEIGEVADRQSTAIVVD